VRREVGTGNGFKRGHGSGFVQGRDVGMATSTCVRAARAGERLKEGRGGQVGLGGQRVSVGVCNE
jgi:hypothetical protein